MNRQNSSMLRNTKSLVLPLGLIFGAVLLPGAARADTALTFTGDGHLWLSIETRGWAFSTDQTIAVTSLGWWDESDDGLGVSHQVGIWNNAGALLVSATVASGTTDPLIDSFRFNSTLTGNPTLAPGNYAIGGLSTLDDYTMGSLFGCCGVTGIAITAPGITFIQNRTNDTKRVFSFPSVWEGGDYDSGIFGPSFQFENVPGPPAIPEPSTMLFSGFGCLILAARYLTVRQGCREIGGELGISAATVSPDACSQRASLISS